jgi:single-stranded-DNA-specific exonuclease
MDLINNDFDIVYAIDENEWNGHKNLQLVLKDVK